MPETLKKDLKPFAVALCESIDKGETNVEECARIAHCSGQTIRNWCNETHKVDEEQAHRLQNNHPNPDVCLKLALARLSGSAFYPQKFDGDTDVDRDGRTTLRDAVLAFSKFNRDASADLDDFLANTADGLNEAESRRAEEGLLKLSEELNRTLGIIKKVRARSGGRR